MGNQIFLTVLSLSLSGTLIGILILGIRPLTRKVFSKKWNYYVWLVMVARLILPISLGVNLIGYLFAAGSEWNRIRAENIVREEIVLSNDTPEPVAAVEPVYGFGLESGSHAAAKGAQQQVPSGKYVQSPSNGQSVFSYLWMVWLFGVVLSACIKGNDYRNFSAYVNADRREITGGKIRQFVDELSGRLGIKKTVKVYESPLISGPILTGLLHPCMILPEGIVKKENISLILHHELIHYKKKDLWYKWLYQAVLCIHWFNPLLYLIRRKLNTDCELACDEAVVEILTVEGRKAYGNVLLDAAESKLKFKKSVLATTLLEDKGTLKERLKAILHYKKIKGVLAVLSVGLLGVIVVLAGIAGAKNSKSSSIRTLNGIPMAGNYVSAWDNVAGRNTSFWDNAGVVMGDSWGDVGDALGDFWDSLGEMWESFGEALSDAADSIGESIGDYYYNADQFLFEKGGFNVDGKAWKLYDDDTLIAGADLHDRWQAYSYMGGGERVKCEGLVLNGSDTYEILYAKEAFTQKLEFEAELKSGRMKLVHVGADGTVTLLAELEEGDSFNDTVSIPLAEGRNTVKIVGQGAKIKKLSLKFENKNHKNVLKFYRSEEEKTAELICGEFREGNINVDRFMDILPYMEKDDLCECAKILFHCGEKLTMDQITDLIIYGDDRVGEYLVDAVEKGTMRAFTGEEIVGDLIYYISSADTVRLVEKMNEPLDFDTLEDILIYLNEADREKCLDIYLGQGNELSYEEFSEIACYLDKDVIKRLYEKR